MKRLALLGFDGMSYDFLMEHLDELPTFKRVIENGCHGVLDSVRPPITVPAFPCLATSKSPDYYGIYTFYKFNKETKELKLWKETKLKDRFWDILSDRGYRSVLFNIPTSYPYKNDFKGSIVASGPEEGKKSYTYPPELWNELKELVGKLKLQPDKSAVDPGYIEEVTEIEEKRIRAIEHLLNSDNWNFAMTFLRQTDRIAHGWWHTDEVLKAYKRADEHLRKMLGNDCDVIIYSDHGFQGLYKAINISYILEKAGLIRLKTKSPHKVATAWLRRKVSSFAKEHGFIGYLRRATPQKVLEKTPLRHSPLLV